MPMKKNILLLLFLVLVIVSNSQPISKNLFGLNAWYINTATTNSTNVPANFGANISNVKKSGAKLVRIGGGAVNFKPLYDFDQVTLAITNTDRLEILINMIRNNGMEPIVQVGFNPVCSTFGTLGGKSQADQATVAANLVDRLNNPSTGKYKSEPIINFIISNEPDFPIGNCSTLPTGFNYTVQTSGATLISSYIKEFSAAMKHKAPFIKIIGPELAQFGNDKTTNGQGNYYNTSNKIMDDLVSNPTNVYSIMGSIPTGTNNAGGQYYIDVLSFHYYPLYATDNSTAVIADPSKLLNGFKGNVIDDGNTGNTNKGLKEMINTNSTGRTLSSGTNQIKLGCTEFNLLNTETTYTENINYAGMVNGAGSRSFLGGQWLSEVFSQAMQNNLEFMNLWSVQEGDCTDGLGYVSNCNSGTKLSAYWHYWMMANNFSGTAFTGTTNVNNVKAFGAKSGDRVAIMLLNQTTTDYDFAVKLNGSASIGTLKVDFGMPNLTGVEYVADGSNLNTKAKIEANSTTLIIYNCKGDISQRYDYKKTGVLASNSYTPVLTNIGPPLIGGAISISGQTVVTNGQCTAISLAPPNYTFTWQNPAPCSMTASPTGTSITLCSCNTSTVTAFTFTVQDPAGCTTSQNINILGDVITGNNSSFFAYVPFVKPSSCAAKTGTAGISVSNAGPYISYSLDGGPFINGVNITGLSVGAHQLSVKNAPSNANGPIITTNFFVPASDPLPYIYAGPDLTVARSCSFALNATPVTSGNNYKWFKGASTTPFALTPYTTTGTWATDVFKVEVTTPGGCKTTDELTVNTTAPGCYPIVKHNDNCPQNIPTEKSAGPSIENITTSQTISADQYINKTYKVHNNAVLTIANCELTFAPGTKIIVQPGGQLNIQNAFLHGCGFNFWEGIDVNGNFNDPNQLYIASSTITDANYPVKADKTLGIVIDNNFFISGIIAIDLDRNKDFSITSNSFYGYEVAINTTRTPVANVSSLIRENTFENVKRAIVLSNDNHTKLDIKCNKFKNYTEYAIYSDNTQLNDIGEALTGAANTFTSASTLINHQLRHNGNAMNYYYDPSNPVSLTTSSTLKATAQVAAANGPCYSAAARMSNMALLTEAKAPKLADISFNAYPNPFINQLTITYSLPANSKNGTLKIFEAASGKEIFTTGLTEGQNKIELTDFNIAAGMYICTLFAGDGTSKSFKLVNIK